MAGGGALPGYGSWGGVAGVDQAWLRNKGGPGPDSEPCVLGVPGAEPRVLPMGHYFPHQLLHIYQFSTREVAGASPYQPDMFFDFKCVRSNRSQVYQGWVENFGEECNC